VTYQQYFPLNGLDVRKPGHTAVPPPNLPALGILPASPLLNRLESLSFPRGTRAELSLVQLCRVEVRKAKAQLELRLATAVKENKKSFYKYINGKRRTKENFHPLLDTAGNVTTEDKEKAEALNTFFTSPWEQLSHGLKH